MGDALSFTRQGFWFGTRWAPPFDLEIDWSHPLALGLQSCVVSNGVGGVIDLVRPRAATASANALRDQGPTASAWSIANNLTTDLDLPLSVFTRGYYNVANNTDNPHILARFAYTNEGTNSGWLMNQAGTKYGIVIWSNTATVIDSSATVVVVGTNSFAFTRDGTTKTLYVNGLSNATVLSGTQTPGTSTGVYQNDANSGTQANAPELYVGMVFTRLLGAAEMLFLHSNPYCLLRPKRHLGSMFMPGSTGLSGTVSQTLFKATTALSGTVGPGGTISQTFFKVTQSLTGAQSSPEDLFFSWRTD